RPDPPPREVREPRQRRLAPALAVPLVESLGRLSAERNEVLFPRGFAVEVGVHAGRYEGVALALEVPRHGCDLMRLVARQVEEHVRLRLLQCFRELALVGPVESDVTGEGAVRAVLAARGDGLDSAPHQLLARRDADKSGAAKYESPGHEWRGR